MSTESAILAGLLVLLLVALRRPLRRPQRHSRIYRWYVDRNSWLWRTRKFLWYYTSKRRCAYCGERRPLHGTRAQPGMQFHHLNYRHLLRERRGRDIVMACRSCHAKQDSWRFR